MFLLPTSSWLSTTLNDVVEAEPCPKTLFNAVGNNEQCGQHVQDCSILSRTTLQQVDNFLPRRVIFINCYCMIVD